MTAVAPLRSEATSLRNAFAPSSRAPAYLGREPPASLFGVDSVLAVIDERLDNAAHAVTIAVLFGKPGRGKTSMAEMLGRTRGAWFQEINASSERRGHELRDALNRFVSDGHQHGLRHKARGGKEVPEAATPLGVLLLDEADGLGDIGQATVASFLAELEDEQIPRRGGWRACVVVACNAMGEIHDVILSRAHVLTEMPKPAEQTLVAAARSWAGPALPRERLDAIPDDTLRALAARSDGDFRAMRQLVSLTMWGGGSAEGRTLSGTPQGDFRQSRAKESAERAAGHEGHGDCPSPFGLGQSCGRLRPSGSASFQSAADGTSASPEAPAPEGGPAVPAALSAGPIRCPRELALLLLRGEGAYETRIWEEVWRQGHRADVVGQWAEQALLDPTVPAPWRRRLVRFQRELKHWDGPDTLLQLLGIYARTMLEIHTRH